MTKQIRHTFHFACTPEKIMSALTEAHHIQKWWTKDASVKNGKGVFQWKGYGWTVELTMEKSEADNTVTWKCTKSNMQNTHAWEGTTMLFKLIPDGSGTKVDFTQSDYRESPCYKVCHEGWKYFLGTSLKSYLETGKGLPYPETRDTSK